MSYSKLNISINSSNIVIIAANLDSCTINGYLPTNIMIHDLRDFLINFSLPKNDSTSWTFIYRVTSFIYSLLLFSIIRVNYSSTLEVKALQLVLIMFLVTTILPLFASCCPSDMHLLDWSTVSEYSASYQAACYLLFLPKWALESRWLTVLLATQQFCLFCRYLCWWWSTATSKHCPASLRW